MQVQCKDHRCKCYDGKREPKRNSLMNAGKKPAETQGMLNRRTCNPCPKIDRRQHQRNSREQGHDGSDAPGIPCLSGHLDSLAPAAIRLHFDLRTIVLNSVQHPLFHKCLTRYGLPIPYEDRHTCDLGALARVVVASLISFCVVNCPRGVGRLSDRSPRFTICFRGSLARRTW
jgi:hypothetical protein